MGIIQKKKNSFTDTISVKEAIIILMIESFIMAFNLVYTLALINSRNFSFFRINVEDILLNVQSMKEIFILSMIEFVFLNVLVILIYAMGKMFSKRKCSFKACLCLISNTHIVPILILLLTMISSYISIYISYYLYICAAMILTINIYRNSLKLFKISSTKLIYGISTILVVSYSILGIVTCNLARHFLNNLINSMILW